MKRILAGDKIGFSATKSYGCSPASIRTHLESQFAAGMHLKNHGKKGWEIDHIVPIAFWDLTSARQRGACFHYTNLQPLWASDNGAKKDKFPWHDPRTPTILARGGITL